ncbi:MAG TPA: (2Fe-2S) ferredoxin domain-containing protein [Verrucomicrobiae bacterium]
MPEKPAPAAVEITICMGSSCFSRGNNRNIEALREFLQAHPLPSAVTVAGHLCEGYCQDGPNVTIGGKMYHAVNPVVITGLLRHFTGGEK